ncbi:hypothetical protein DFJ73DRAFT_820537 [Zopfochytrium polystomum]|nr:hypothetical protein DFJ73DRAFT_820537 [Zopfochytrium polystomum]
MPQPPVRGATAAEKDSAAMKRALESTPTAPFHLTPWNDREALRTPLPKMEIEAPPPVARRPTPAENLQTPLTPTDDLLNPSNLLSTVNYYRRAFGLSQYWAEKPLLDKMVYRNKNQHRAATYFRKIVMVKRLLLRLQELNLPAVLAELLGHMNVPFKKMRAERRKANPASLPTKFALSKSMMCVTGAFALLTKLDSALVETYVSCRSTARETFFMTFCLTIMGACARLHLLGKKMLLQLRELYSKMHPFLAVCPGAPFPNSDCLPSELIMTMFESKLEGETISLDDLVKDGAMDFSVNFDDDDSDDSDEDGAGNGAKGIQPPQTTQEDFSLSDSFWSVAGTAKEDEGTNGEPLSSLKRKRPLVSEDTSSTQSQERSHDDEKAPGVKAAKKALSETANSAPTRRTTAQDTAGRQERSSLVKKPVVAAKPKSTGIKGDEMDDIFGLIEPKGKLPMAKPVPPASKAVVTATPKQTGVKGDEMDDIFGAIEPKGKLPKSKSVPPASKKTGRPIAKTKPK